MGTYVSVRGWIEMGDEQVPLVRALIERDEDELGLYKQSWCFQTGGGGHAQYIFFGCTVRADRVDNVQRQVRRIAETVKTFDDTFVDFTEGDFLLEHEKHEEAPQDYPLVRWTFRDGVFSERVEMAGGKG